MAAPWAVFASGCSKTEYGGRAPSGPPAPGVDNRLLGHRRQRRHRRRLERRLPALRRLSDGKGYVPVSVRALQGQEFHRQHLNLGIPTAVISTDFEAIGAQYGRLIFGNFIERQMPFVQPDATLVDDVRRRQRRQSRLPSALGAGAGGGNPAGYIDPQVRAFATDYATLVAGIRSSAPVDAHHRPERAERRRACRISPARRSTSVRRSSGSSVGFHDRRQCADVARGHRHRSDV